MTFLCLLIYELTSFIIAKANDLGTTKGALFEDMDNMISQIDPIVNEMESL